MCVVYALSTNASGLQSLTWPQINIKLFLKNMHRRVMFQSTCSASHIYSGETTRRVQLIKAVWEFFLLSMI